MFAHKILDPATVFCPPPPPQQAVGAAAAATTDPAATELTSISYFGWPNTTSTFMQLDRAVAEGSWEYLRAPPPSSSSSSSSAYHHHHSGAVAAAIPATPAPTATGLAGDIRLTSNDGEPADVRFLMMEKVAVKNRASEYRCAISSSYEDSPLSTLFFSAGNVEIVQNAIRAGVYEKSKGQFVVAPQNVDEIKTVMRNAYLQNAKDLSPSNGITHNISELNRPVINSCVTTVYNESVAYTKYLRDKSFLAVPLNHPLQPDRKYRQLSQPPPFF